LLLALFTFPALSQQEDIDAKVNALLQQIDNGQVFQVRQELPPLMAKNPNNPGLLFVQGRIATNGAEAVRIYQSIVDNFPSSSWADDALHRVYQFYYSIGLYRTADLKLQQLKRDYPSSPFLTNLPQRDTTATPVAVEDTAAMALPGLPEQAVAPTGQSFALQVGAFSTQANAEKIKGQFETEGYPVEIINKVKDGRSLFIVLVGSFASYDEAKAKTGEIQKKFSTTPLVVTK